MKYLSRQAEADFRQSVWEIVRQVPSGKVITYGQVAAFIPLPKSVSPQDYRAWSAVWVGGAMAACQGDVPWQRVINSQGKISQRPGSGANQQRQMLENEGVAFDERGKVSLTLYGWSGPSDEWLQSHGLVSKGGS
jgi:methylated-DNA-protein-cysteine methyltransferase-like protein